MTGLETVGIIEGFYGPPWRHEDRCRVLRYLGDIGATTYVYAPKNDPLHRDRWREPYLAEEWARFEELLAIAAEAGVDLWFGLTPLGIEASVEADLEALAAKLGAARQAGFRHFCLLVDDTPESFASGADAGRFQTLAAMHVHLVEQVRAWLGVDAGDARLWFVPQHYHGDPTDAYVREVGAGIPEDVEIMWTGPEVCSLTIDRDHLEDVAEQLRRPVLLWDNHPVNDGPMERDPHLGPLTGRTPRPEGVTSGILANAALQPEASLIAADTFVTYARDPAGYDPDAAWREALLRVTGDEDDANAVALLAALSPRSPLFRKDPIVGWLVDPIVHAQEAWRRSGGGDPEALAELERLLTALGADADRLERLGNDALRRDLAPWVLVLRSELAAARACLDVLRDTAAGRTVPAATRDRALERLTELPGAFHFVAGQQLEMLGRWCLREAGER